MNNESNPSPQEEPIPQPSPTPDAPQSDGADSVVRPAGIPPLTRAERLARLAWGLPFLAIVIGLLTKSLRENSQWIAVATSVVSLVLIGGGLLLSIAALLGMRKWGGRNVLVPALVGLGVSGYLIVATISGYVQLRNFNAQQREQAARDIALAQQQGREAALDAGWMGLYGTPEFQLAAWTIPSSSAHAQGMLKALGKPVEIVIFNIHNQGSQVLEVDPRGGEFLLRDAKEPAPLPDIEQVLSTASEDPKPLLAVYGPPLRVDSGQTVSRLLFLPEGTDPQKLVAIRLKANGQDVVIPGRYLTREEKAVLAQAAANATATAPVATHPVP
jgi:hypothetical protein